MSQPLSYADIIWKDDVPCSVAFDDIYFSRAGGVAETEHVFIDGNDLPQRFETLRDHFTIIETGFGTGLNFLVTAQHFLNHAPKDTLLHFISTEKYPLHPDDLVKALSFFPEFSIISTEMMQQYPPAHTGFHRLYLAGGRIMLTLLLGDINDTLPQLCAKADAWFLDGFAPAKNESMWNDALFHHIARLTKPEGTLATYSAAGAVRRALTACGFDVEKTKGYGHKRDMVKARMITPPAPSADLTDTPWFIPKTSANIHEITQKKAIIIGGGMAGCFTAASLSKRHFDVTLIERHETLCEEASGNPYGILQPAITAAEDVAGNYHLAGFLHSLRRIQTSDVAFTQSGAIHLSHKREGKETILPQGFLEVIEQEELRALSGCHLNATDHAFYLNQSGYLRPKAFIENVLAPYQNQIRSMLETEALSFYREDGMWHVCNQQQKTIAAAPFLILANANDAVHFKATSWLPLQPVRGQLTYLPATQPSHRLKTILCHETGYILPADASGNHTLGATYEPFRHEKGLLAVSHQRNIAGFTHALGEAVDDDIDLDHLKGRVSFRCTTPDRLPFIGPAPDNIQFSKDYANLSHGKYQSLAHGTYHDGLYLNLAHGSRGLSSAPLAAEIIASYLCNEPQPLPLELLHAIHPARWLIRQLKKGKSVA